MTKEEIRAYRVITTELAQLERIIEELEQSAYGVRAIALSGLPKAKGCVSDPMALADKLADLKMAYINCWDRLIDKREQIEAAFVGLPDKERILMRAHYIEGLGWEAVAEAMEYSVQRVWQIHGEVLKKYFN